MTVKKQYSIGDSAWVYGVNTENKPTKGQIVHKFILDGHNEVFYVIAVPTSIEDLLEVRTWDAISQDEYGPAGGFRDGMENINSTKRYLSKVGVKIDILDFNDRLQLSNEIENKVNVPPAHNLSRNNRSKRKSFNRKNKQ